MAVQPTCPRSEEEQPLWDTLFAAHHQPIFRTAYRYLHNAEDAADVVSDIFLTLLGSPALLQHLYPAQVVPYLHGMARNMALSLLRRRQAQARAHLRMAGCMPFPSPDTERQALIRCALTDMERALILLPPGEAAALQMKVYLRLPDAEVSRLLHIRCSTVRTRVARARRHLRLSVAWFAGAL